MGAAFSCCERGGCCRQAPPKLIKSLDKNNQNEVVRINLLFDVGCASHGVGICEEIPPELFSKVSVREWVRLFYCVLP
jgi:hypothetical protein